MNIPGTELKCARVSEGLSAITTAKPLEYEALAISPRDDVFV
jgi:hypothetical protein